MISIDLQQPLLNPYEVYLAYAMATSTELYQKVKQAVFASFGPLNTVNDWVSLESLGNITAIKAKKISGLFQSHPAKSVTLEIHLDYRPLSNDNFYALIFLAQVHSNLTVTIRYPRNNRVHHCLEVLQAQPALVLNLLEVPESKASSDRTTTTLVPEFHLTAAIDWASPSQPLIEKVINYAFICLKLGAFELATATLEHLVYTVAQTELREYALLKLQMCRLHSHQFKAAALQPYPTKIHYLDQHGSYFLYYIKAYCATMSRQLDIAHAYFTLLDIHEDMPASNEQQLYQLNIFALFHVLSGNKATALKLEQRIEQCIQSGVTVPASLQYVNCINTARLYKMDKQFDKAESYYQAAYQQIAGGGYTNSDFIYYNLNLAMLWEPAGDNETAYQYWLKACVHWLVLENPYALAWRAKLVLMQSNNDGINDPISIEVVNAYLHQKLLSFARLTHRNVDATHPPLQLSLNQPAVDKQRCIVTRNGVYFASKTTISESPYQQQSPLGALVSTLLRQDINLDGYPTLLVDTYCSENLPTLEATRVLAALNLCNSAEYLSEPLKDITLSNVYSYVQVSSLISEVTAVDTGIALQFQRTFMNQQLQGSHEIRMFNQLRHSEAKQERHTIAHEDLMTINHLLSKKIVSFIPKEKEA